MDQFLHPLYKIIQLFIYKKGLPAMKFLFVYIYSHKMSILISGNSFTVQIFLLLL